MRYCWMILFLLAFACKEKPTGLAKMPLMGSMDSVEVLYFKEPGNDRYFTYYPTTDERLIQSITSDVSVPSVDSRDCPKDGKIYCFSKGAVINTIYFSLNDCRELRFIVNGNLYHFPMSEETLELISYFKARAK